MLPRSASKRRQHQRHLHKHRRLTQVTRALSPSRHSSTPSRTCTLAPPDNQPTEGKHANYLVDLPWHEAMLAGAIIQVPRIEGLTADAMKVKLANDVAQVPQVRIRVTVQNTSRKKATRTYTISGAQLLPASQQAQSVRTARPSSAASSASQ